MVKSKLLFYNVIEGLTTYFASRTRFVYIIVLYHTTSHVNFVIYTMNNYITHSGPLDIYEIRSVDFF